MKLEEKTRKFLDKLTESHRDKNDDIPIKYLKKALSIAINEYFKRQKDLDFILSLCGDINLELVGNIYEDEKLYSYTDYLMEIDRKSCDIKELNKKILALLDYIEY